MSDLAERLDRLGLASYAERLALEGFDTWETVLDITESDLQTLGFKLGHRRKLQRAIAESRGQAVESALLLADGKVALHDGYQSDDSMQEAKESSGHATPATTQPSASQPSTGTKRKYRRHPKADEHAPERPPSAYVIFSNQIREELKGQDLSFTEIAKLVGERWQVLEPSIREAFEKQAASAKERYYAQMAEYKKTAQYQEYQQYLADFKAKHATPRSDGKRSKIQPDSGTEGPSKPTGLEHRRASLAESAAGSHFRTRSNPNSAALGLYGGYGPPSASTSPNQTSIGLQSPLTQHAYSPRSSPPPSAPVYGTSYDLPHHARGTQSTADLRLGDYRPAQMSPMARQWQRPPLEDNTGHPPLTAEALGRRSSRALGSLPPLVHQDTTASSHTDSLPTPPIPYQAHILPPLDPSKADRTLPTPLPSITPSLIPSPHDVRIQDQSPPMPPLLARPPPTTQTTQFDALLRASELARDADLKDEALRRGGSGSTR